MDELLGGKGKSNSKSSLDDLLDSGSKIKLRGGSPEITSERTPKGKLHRGSPAPSIGRARKNRSPQQSDDDSEDEDYIRRAKGGLGSPGMSRGRGSPTVEQKRTGRSSPPTTQKNKTRKGLLDSSSDDHEDEENNVRVDKKEKKMDIPKPKPRTRSSSGLSEKSKISSLLASDSDEEEDRDNKRKKQTLIVGCIGR